MGQPAHTAVSNRRPSRTPLERAAGAGESPVGERRAAAGRRPEYARTRGIRAEAGRTTAQGARHDATDSVPVPRGKGEKHPGEGGERGPESPRRRTVGAGLRAGDGVLFVERAGELRLGGEAKGATPGAAAKASPKRAPSRREQTRNRVSYPSPGGRRGNARWTAAPSCVAKRPDERWVGVKCQSNPEIAGSPRNALRCSLGRERAGGRALVRRGGLAAYQLDSNSECPRGRPGVRPRVPRSVAKTGTTETTG